jgi:hypothetical protein
MARKSPASPINRDATLTVVILQTVFAASITSDESTAHMLSGLSSSLKKGNDCISRWFNIQPPPAIGVAETSQSEPIHHEKGSFMPHLN